ncbi:MAG: 3-hydroxyacyl-CoA dehydrogenase [Vibrio sp.]
MTYSIQTVAVVGAGTMGAGIAQVAAQSGYQVILFDLQKGKAEQAKAEIALRFEKRVQNEKMTQESKDSILSAMVCSETVESMADADLVIEAIVEDLAIKQSLFQQLEEICRESTILATNTSSISITSIASVLTKPERFVGLHFFNPAPLMKLVEVVNGIATETAVSEVAKEWAQSCQKHAVVTRSLPGFIVNRVARPFYAEGLRALEVGVAQVQDIDTYIKQAGQFNMGPFELMDLIGHDVNYAVTKSVYDAYYQDKRFLPSLIQKELVDAGFLGRKSGRGFYRYHSETAKPIINLAKIESEYDHFIVSVHGNWTVAPDFLALIGHEDQPVASIESSPNLFINGIFVAPTQGYTATELAHAKNMPVVVFDHCQDFLSSPVIALAAAAQNTQEQTEQIVAFFQSKGKQVLIVKDYPGLLLWRTWMMLINEALDLVNQNGASFDDVDIAMKSGVNYPVGPIEKGKALGWHNVLESLENLQAYYGEERYRASPLLRELTFKESMFQKSTQCPFSGQSLLDETNEESVQG